MSNPLLLVVEDDQNLAKLLEYNLNRAGYRCHLSGTGEDGFEQLSKKSVDLVLLDVMLPGMDGFELCRKIRLINFLVINSIQFYFISLQ